MKKLHEMNVTEFTPKDGDIKVDSLELKQLLNILEWYHEALHGLSDELDELQKEKLEYGLDYTEFFQNKYIVLGDLRQKEKHWYDFLQTLNKKEFIENNSKEDIEELRNELWDYYIESKKERKRLSNELSKKKKDSFHYFRY